MTIPRPVLAVTLLMLMALALTGSRRAATAQDGNTLAFTNVNVIPMDEDRVLPDQTVLVQGDRIVALGDASAVAIPAEAQVIDGNGRYLIPGLADMHFHILDNEDALTLAIANGITTVRDPNADYVGTGAAILAARDEIAAGKRLGPAIMAAKSFISLPPQVAPLLPNLDRVVGPWLAIDPAVISLAVDPVSGREMVIRAHEDGYDFAKINWYLSRETFDSIVATAGELEMPVLAHVPADVGIEHAIRSGVEIQHNGNLLAYLAKDYLRSPGPNYLDHFDLSEADQKLPELVALMAENGVAYTPTMMVDVTAFELFDNLPDWSQATLFERPGYRYVPGSYLSSWKDASGGEFGVVARSRGASSVADIVPPAASREEILALHLRQLKALVDAGVPVLVGTDASAVGVVWGFAIHEELELFVRAGLSPYRALAAATRIPSEVVSAAREWGTIAEGKRADLVLLGANPLDDIANTRRIDGVMVRGRWLPQEVLQSMLDELAARYEAQGVVRMEHVTISGQGIQSLAPAGWRELEPGVFARGNPDVDPTMLLQMSARGISAKELALPVLSRFGVAEIPAQPFLKHESAALDWALYRVERPVAPIAVALAETEGAAYMVLLLAPSEEIDALAETVLLPAVNALAPLD